MNAVAMIARCMAHQPTTPVPTARQIHCTRCTGPIVDHALWLGMSAWHPACYPELKG